MNMKKNTKRKEQILQSLALMLEKEPGARITTSKLANEVGVSEAALYRHFPSKARMFEGLIEFAEQEMFSRINLISKEVTDLDEQCQKIITLLLTFAGRNPGISRLLTGEALTGEHERLRGRISQLFNRIETHIKQLFRQAELNNQQKFLPDASSRANILMAFTEGRIQQFVRTNFLQSPLANWEDEWSLLKSICY